ncbi:MAG TPA: NADH-quinone oxidoreductase subunit J [Abditibacteriaceae bacterium]|nr:NADH-quinone oxidoreductase subunit J [Abditibacteriaceae bacterium]
MTVESIVFTISALLVVLSALMVVANRHPVYSALYLVLTLLGVAAFFLQLQAPFLAAVQVIVYAGAIMVLFLFVIMLLGEDKPLPGERKVGLQVPLGILLSIVLILQIGFALARQPSTPTTREPAMIKTIVSEHASTEEIAGANARFGSVKAIGNTLFTDYVFAFEATSLVLLVAMIGVVVLSKRRL